VHTFEDLMGAVAGGDMDALGELYGALRTAVYSAALSIVRDPSAAEEVLHDTFVRVYERANQYRPGSNPKAWIVAIARNLAIDRLRRRQRETAVSEVEVAAQTKGVVGAGAATDSTAIDALGLVAALEHLDPTDREIVVLYTVVGLAHREIATQLCIPEGTVRWRYRRALRRLAELIEGDGK